MKRISFIFLFICLQLVSSSIAQASENIAVYPQFGGSIEYSGTVYGTGGYEVEKAFDGIVHSGNQMVYNVSANVDKPIDRIWAQKVQIDKIGMEFNGDRDIDYKFSYWDLKTNDWIEIISVDKDIDGISNRSTEHILLTPIVTTKIRFHCTRSNPVNVNLYELLYYGQFIEENAAPLAPTNAELLRVSHTEATINWSAPNLDSDEDPVVGFRIYKGTDLLAAEDELQITESVTEYSYDVSVTREQATYSLVSVAESETESEAVSLELLGSGTIKGNVVDTSAAPLVGVLVELFNESAEKLTDQTTNTNGEFEFDYALEGNYELVFTKDDYEGKTTEVLLAADQDFVLAAQILEAETPPLVSTNIAVYPAYGGSIEYTGTVYEPGAGVEKAFDGLVNNDNQMVYNVVANIDKPIDRIWDEKVQIDKIILTRSVSTVPMTYVFFYWDFIISDWVEFYNVSGSTINVLEYILPTPIVTNKIRFLCNKEGTVGSSYMNIYELEYYGDFAPNLPPKAPLNLEGTRLAANEVLLSWSDPGPDSEGDPVVGFRVYRETEEGLLLLADEEELTVGSTTEFTYLDDTCSRARETYQVRSVDAYNDLSEAAEIEVLGSGSITGKVSQQNGDLKTALPGLTVELYDQTETKLADVLTDDEGAYFFAFVIEGSYELLYLKTGYDIETAPIVVTADADILVDEMILAVDIEPPLPPLVDDENPPQVEQGRVTIFWLEPGAADDGDFPSGYNIYRASTADFSDLEGTLYEAGVQGTSYIDHEITFTPIYYFIKSYDKAGNPSDEGLLIQVEAQLVGVPQIPIENNGLYYEAGQEITLTWLPVEGAVAYDLMVSSSPDFTDSFQVKENISGNTTSWEDSGETGKRYWRVRAKLANGASGEYSESGWFEIVDLGLPGNKEALFLFANPAYISRAGENLQIQFGLTQTTIVSLNVFNLQGKLVRNLISNRQFPVGVHNCEFTGEDDAKRALPNGLYLMQLNLNISGRIVNIVKRIGIFR